MGESRGKGGGGGQFGVCRGRSVCWRESGEEGVYCGHGKSSAPGDQGAGVNGGIQVCMCSTWRFEYGYSNIVYAEYIDPAARPFQD